MFEVGSWPWTLAHQMMMVIIQRTESPGTELQRMSVDQTMGPLGRLEFGWALGLIGHPPSHFFA